MPMQAVADFIASVFECFGATSRYSSIGYGKSFGTNAGGGFGLSAGSGEDLKALIKDTGRSGERASQYIPMCLHNRYL